MQPDALEAHIQAVKRDGYTILENILQPEIVSALERRIREIEADTAGTPEEIAADTDHSFLRTAGLFQLDPMFRDTRSSPTSSTS